MPPSKVAKEEVQDCAKPGEKLTIDKCHERWCSWYPNSDGPECQVGRSVRRIASACILPVLYCVVFLLACVA